MWLSCGFPDVTRSVLEPSRTFLGLHVGSCWLMLRSGWLKVASSWLQDGSRSLCWLKLVSRRPTWPPKASQVLQDETKMAFKMASTSICFSFLVFFSRFASGPTFSNEFLLFGSLECINFCQFLEQISMNFGSLLASWVVHAPRGLKIPS